MPIAHTNYYPPAGAVLDENEPQAYWNGKAWQKNKKNYAVPSGHRLVGRPGGALAGWYYDWGKRAWMEPDHAAPAATTAITPSSGTRKPRPAQPKNQEDHDMDKCSGRQRSKALEIVEVVKAVAVVGGPVIVGIATFLKKPDRPPVSAGQPQWLIEENQNRFTQNIAAYEDRQTTLNNWGQLLTTLGSSGLSANDKAELRDLIKLPMLKKAA